jgi:hypothetical protein
LLSSCGPPPDEIARTLVAQTAEFNTAVNISVQQTESANSATEPTSTPIPTNTPILTSTHTPTQIHTKTSTATYTLTPTASITPSPTATATSVPTGIVTVETANLRSGPGLVYDTITKLPLNTSLTVIERSSDSKWMHVQIEDRDQSGWISSTVASLNIDINTIRLASDIPPTPTPAPKPYDSANPTNYINNIVIKWVDLFIDTLGRSQINTGLLDTYLSYLYTQTFLDSATTLKDDFQDLYDWVVREGHPPGCIDLYSAMSQSAYLYRQYWATLIEASTEQDLSKVVSATQYVTDALTIGETLASAKSKCQNSGPVVPTNTPTSIVDQPAATIEPTSEIMASVYFYFTNEGPIANITYGHCVELNWSIENTTSSTTFSYNGVPEKDTKATRTECPDSTKEVYRLTVEDGSSLLEKTLTVNTQNAPFDRTVFR